MEITKKFGNTFRDMMRAKLRWFWRRSILRYAIAVALITFGLHGIKGSMDPGEIVLRGGIYFFVLCLGVLVLHIVVATIQSRRMAPRTVTFSENVIVVTHEGKTVTRDWDWIIAAEDSPTMIALLVQKLPRLELFLPKSQLEENEYRALNRWLVSHGKLAETGHDVQ